MVILTPGFPEIDIDERSGSDKPYVLSEEALLLYSPGVESVREQYLTAGFIEINPDTPGYSQKSLEFAKNNLISSYGIQEDVDSMYFTRHLQLPNLFSHQQQIFKARNVRESLVAILAMKIIDLQHVDELQRIVSAQKERQVGDDERGLVDKLLRSEKIQQAKAKCRPFGYFQGYKSGELKHQTMVINFPEFSQRRAINFPSTMRRVNPLAYFSGSITSGHPHGTLDLETESVWKASQLPFSYQHFTTQKITEALKYLKLQEEHQKKIHEEMLARREERKRRRRRKEMKK